jgi:hypothetical protein
LHVAISARLASESWCYGRFERRRATQEKGLSHHDGLVTLVVLPRKDLAVTRNRKHEISIARHLRQAF